MQMPPTAEIEYVEVYPANGVWMCRYTSEPMKSYVQELMGTSEIPSAFTTKTPLPEVLKALRAIPSNSRTAFVEAGR